MYKCISCEREDVYRGWWCDKCNQGVMMAIKKNNKKFGNKRYNADKAEAEECGMKIDELPPAVELENQLSKAKTKPQLDLWQILGEIELKGGEL